MGFLTTFTIYNDGIDGIRKDSKEFCDNLYFAAIRGEVSDVAHGNHCNLVKVQKTRHADDHTIYIHMGNTLCELNAYSDETLKGLENHQEYYESMINFMEREAKSLKKKLKEIKLKNGSDS